MHTYKQTLEELKNRPKSWLVTGVAGFIGSNLLETLLKLDQRVTGLDNFITGHRHNLSMVQAAVSGEQWSNFRFMEADIREPAACRQACAGAHYVLHQAALGSVPRSLADPIRTNQCNVDGFLNMLVAAREAEVQSFVYAASSSTYGDEPHLPKQEERIGRPLSPYAATKLINEIYAEIFKRCYDFSSIGLRYFNVFGARQDPRGAYAAVIPKWFAALLAGEAPTINGDGETSRDFCYIENVVQANILAATASAEARDKVYNVAFGQRTTLNELFAIIRDEVSRHRPEAANIEALHAPFRPGDVRHSLADVSRARALLGYAPQYDVRQGLTLAGDWYAKNL